MADTVRKPTGKLTWENFKGNTCMRPINFTLDIRDFEGRAAFALLAIAANRHLGTSDLVRLLDSFGVERSWNYVKRRLWMVDPVKHSSGMKPGADGQDGRAREIIRQYPRKSARWLVRFLDGHGIKRGKTWVWQNRV